MVTLCLSLLIGCSYAILNGKRAMPGQFRYQVSIQRADNKHLCGGAVLNEHWIATAAQCAQGVYAEPKNLRLLVGTHSLESSGGKVFEVDRVVSHPEFNATTHQSDIALLRTKTPILIDHFNVFPISYPSFVEDYKMEQGLDLIEVTMSGWGPIEVSLICFESRSSRGI